jgi:predicted transcriptional regulator
MSFTGNKELAENKLILLYIIDKISMTVSNLQLTKVVLENKFMNYFTLQQLLNELCESNFLSNVDLDGKEAFLITESGKKTLSFFENLIPPGIKGRIDSTITEIKRSIKTELLITADFLSENDKDFIVNLKINEEFFSMIDLKLTVGTKNDARLICNNWKDYSQEIYSDIINVLLKKRD